MVSRENILYGRTDINMAGPGIVMLKTAAQLVKRGCSVVVVSSGGTLQKEFERQGINSKVIEDLAINRRSIWQVMVAVYKLKKVIKEQDIRIIHGHNMFFTILAFMASAMARKDTRFYTTIHGYGKEWLCKYLPGKIIVVSKFLQERLISKGVHPDKIEVVYNGLIEMNLYAVTSTKIDKELGKKIRFTIISVAVMTGLKGHDKIINVLARLQSKGYDVEVVFVGDGCAKQALEELSESKGVKGNVRFLGRRTDVPSILMRGDLFLHLTSLETFGMVVVEAMAAGLPVIASDLGGIPELIDEGNNGYLVDNEDYDDIAEKIIGLINSKEQRLAMAKYSLATVEERFRIEATIDRLVSLYQLS